LVQRFDAADLHGYGFFLKILVIDSSRGPISKMASAVMAAASASAVVPAGEAMAGLDDGWAGEIHCWIAPPLIARSQDPKCRD
jgi:hypothetical protein